MATVNLMELRAECVSQVAAAEQQVKALQVKIVEHRRKIAAIDTITGKPISDPEDESEVVDPEDESSEDGTFTPVFAYWRPILEVIVEMGGRGKRQNVIDATGKKMAGILKPADYGKLPKSGRTRWSNRVVWQASDMRQPENGLIKNGSPRGIWEITEAGRKWLDDNKA